MSSKKTRVVIDSGNGKSVVQDIAAQGPAAKIKVQPKVKYLLKDDADGFAPENVTVTRVGHDLDVALEGESRPSLVLQDYFSESEVGGLFGSAEDGELYSYVATDGGEIFTLAEGEQLPIALGGESYGANASSLGSDANSGGFGFVPAALLGGLALFGVAAQGGGGGSSPVWFLPPEDETPPPPEKEVPPPAKLGLGLGGAIDTKGETMGRIDPGGLTDDPQPQFFGGGTPGNTITLYDDGKVIGSTVVNEKGDWWYIPGQALAEGKHHVTITEKTPDGPESEPSEPFEFEVDTTPADDQGSLVVAPGEFEGLVFDIQSGDEVDGGRGDDLMRITSTDFARLDGGDGIDTLVLDGSDMRVDLSALGPKVQHIEKFDLGTGHNTLALKAGDVLANGQADMVLKDGKTQMVVNGAQGEVDLLDGQTEGWSSQGPATVEGVTYNVYTNMAGTAELLIEDKVQVAIL